MHDPKGEHDERRRELERYRSRSPHSPWLWSSGQVSGQLPASPDRQETRGKGAGRMALARRSPPPDGRDWSLPPPSQSWAHSPLRDVLGQAKTPGCRTTPQGLHDRSSPLPVTASRGRVTEIAGVRWYGRRRWVPSERNISAACRVAKGAGGATAAPAGLLWRCGDGASPSLLGGPRGRFSDGGSRSVGVNICPGTPVPKGQTFGMALPRRRGSSS